MYPMCVLTQRVPCEAGTTYPSGAPVLTHVFLWRPCCSFEFIVFVHFDNYLFWSLHFTLFISLYWFTIILSRHVVFCLFSLHSQTTHKINHLMFFLLMFSGCFQLNTSLITGQFYTEDALECSKNCRTHFGLMVRTETVLVTVIFGI